MDKNNATNITLTCTCPTIPHRPPRRINKEEIFVSTFVYDDDEEIKVIGVKISDTSLIMTRVT